MNKLYTLPVRIESFSQALMKELNKLPYVITFALLMIAFAIEQIWGPF